MMILPRRMTVGMVCNGAVHAGGSSVEAKRLCGRGAAGRAPERMGTARWLGRLRWPGCAAPYACLPVD